MSDTNGSTGPVTEPADTGRTKIANRDWIDDSKAVTTEELATGVRYEFLGRTKDGVTLPPDGDSYTVMFRDLNDQAKNMLIGFGAVTLMGNVTNTWMGDKSEDRLPKASAAIADRFATLNEGRWIDRAAGAIGARIDKDALAQAIVLVAREGGKSFEEAAIRQKLEDDSEFFKTVRQVPSISAEYAKIVGKSVKTADDVFAMLAQ